LLKSAWDDYTLKLAYSSFSLSSLLVYLHTLPWLFLYKLLMLLAAFVVIAARNQLSHLPIWIWILRRESRNPWNMSSATFPNASGSTFCGFVLSIAWSFCGFNFFVHVVDGLCEDYM